MIPSEVWDGTYDATGGYIVVQQMVKYFAIIFITVMNLKNI